MSDFSSFLGNEAIPLPVGFQYVAQDNYHLVDVLEAEVPKTINYLYSDGATSCIILIIVGRNAKGNALVGLAHLSKLASFEAFFELIKQNFRGGLAIYAQGANPPENTDADVLTNEQILMDWIDAHSLPTTQSVFYVSQQTLALGEGNPLEANRDCLGIDLKTLQVSNQRLTVTSMHRDEYQGLQTLYSLFGQELPLPLWLRSAVQPFTQGQIINLVNIAFHYNWNDILAMSDDEMLHYFSTTPQYEVPWFCDALRQSARYVQNHLHLIHS